MIDLEPPVSFSCLSAEKKSDPEAIIGFNGGAAKDPFIREVVQEGLDSGSYSAFVSNLDSLFKSGYITNQAHVLGNLVVCLGEKDNRDKLAKLLLADDAVIKRIQEASYIHHNGFRKIVLAQSSLFKIRLHVFETLDSIVAQENIHDHRWPFSSLCLLGDLTCKIYTVSELGQKACFHYLYSPVGADDSYVVEPAGQGNVMQGPKLRIDRGMGYYLPENTLHRILNRSGERVVTLVVTGTPVKQTCNLYSENEFKEEVNQVTRIDETDIRNAIKEFKHITCTSQLKG